MNFPEYNETLPELQDHPIFSGSQSVGMISGDAPKWLKKLPPNKQEFIQKYGHSMLGRDLQNMGLRHEATEGRYGAPERSYIVYGPTKEQMIALGNKYGQDSVLHMQAGHKTAKMHYTDLAEDESGNSLKGHHVPSLGTYAYHATEQPEDYYTKIPSKGYLRLNLNFDNPPVKEGQITKAEVKAKLLMALKKAIEEGY